MNFLLVRNMFMTVFLLFAASIIYLNEKPNSNTYMYLWPLQTILWVWMS